MKLQKLSIGIQTMRNIEKIVFLILLLHIALFAQVKKDILVLHSYNSSMSWEKNIDQAINDVLQPDENGYVLHTEYMDIKRVYTPEYLNQLKQFYKDKYKNTHFDLILTSDNNAFEFLKKNRNALFGDIPTVFCGVNNFKDSDLKGTTNFTGVATFS